MRGRGDPHDDPAPARSRPRDAVPVPTLGQLLRPPYWTWLRCDACGHRVAVALIPFVIRWGRPRVIGRSPPACAILGVRPTRREPATPVGGDAEAGWQPFPTLAD